MIISGKQYRSIEYKLGFVTVSVLGGSYYHKPAETKGVKMAVEIKLACDIDIPTRDFSVPAVYDMDNGIREAITYLAKNETMYVGCLGGIGRTGLFLSCLAKALGYKDPVQYVRDNYDERAVETNRQKEFVERFDVSDFKWQVRKAKLLALWYYS